MSVILITTLVYYQSSIAQIAQSDFAIAKLPCKTEILELNNQSTFADTYLWDFCIGDLDQSPTVELLSSEINKPYKVELIKYSGNYTGFVTSRTDQRLYRLDFTDSSLTNFNIIELGVSYPNLLSIDVFSIGTSWFGFLISYDNELIKLSFGNSPLNMPTIELLGNFGLLGNPSDLVVIRNNSKIFVLITNSSNNVTIVQYDELITSPPIVNNINIVGANQLGGISVLNEGNEWLAFITSRLNGKLFKMKLGTDLSISSPIITEVDNLPISLVSPAGISTVEEGNYYYHYIQSQTGDIYKINDGISMLDLVNDSSTNLGNFGLLGNNWGFSIYQLNSNWIGFSANNSGKNLYQLTFPNSCNVSSNYSNEFEPSNIFFYDPGSYLVELKAFDLDNNVSVLTKNLEILDLKPAILSININDNRCVLSPVEFSPNIIEGQIIAYDWNFGDGSSNSILQNPSHNYVSTSEYDIQLSAESNQGCITLVKEKVSIYNSPIASYAPPTGQVCTNNPITFTNTSTFDSGSLTSWLWDFGDGSPTSTDQGVSHIFPRGGTYTVSLTAIMPTCTDIYVTDIIIEEAPSTLFSFNNTCNRTTSTFTDQTTGSNLTSWSWDFGDGNTSTEQNTSHTYAAPGNYDVTLIVTNNTGCFTSTTQTVVNYSNPVTKFKNDLPCSTTPIQFTDQSLVDNANIVGWEWDFGDGTTSPDQHPVHLYGQTGNFTVKLKAYSQFGCVDSTESLITVTQGPEVDFEWDKSCEGEATTFTDLTNSFGNQITNWTWIINGVLHTNQNPTYTFSSAGIYTVQLSVTMDNLCTQTLSEDIIIEEPPIVQFDYYEDCSTSNTAFYDLTDQTNDKIIIREWRVDGAIISSDSVAIATLEPGNYEITLSVITDSGCEEITTSTVSLVGSPTADFNSNTVYGAAPLLINFTNISSGGTNYEWSFGDANNSTSTERNPSFIYTEIGIYNVTLRTSSAVDCYDESVLQLEVVAPITKATLLAITPVVDNEKTNYILTIENSGTTLITNSTNIIFRTDYGAEIVEPINAVIYAGKTINYSPSFAISTNSSTQNICVELRSPKAIQLDEECIVLNSSTVISEPYPNPTSSLADIDVLLKKESSIEIRVINRAGQPVYTNSFVGVIGLNKTSIDGSTLPQGLYIIEVKTEGKTEKFKLSIVR